jgi:anti-sigma regulatory factor (Ser/Thr protein kinase)
MEMQLSSLGHVSTLPDEEALACMPAHLPVGMDASYPARPSFVGQARADLRKACAGRHDVPLDDVLLVASELLGNAILYGRPLDEDAYVSLSLRIGDDVARVEVCNAGAPFEIPATVIPLPRPDLPYGRGLYIVDHVSDSWGQGLSPEGRVVVWSEVGLSEGCVGPP